MCFHFYFLALSASHDAFLGNKRAATLFFFMFFFLFVRKKENMSFAKRQGENYFHAEHGELNLWDKPKKKSKKKAVRKNQMTSFVGK